MPETGTPHRALVLEDDSAVQQAVTVILERVGFDVAAVVSAAEAIQAVERINPDAMVIDLALVGHKGVHLLADLSAAVPGSVIVALSPFEALGHVQTLLETVVDAGTVAVVGLSDLRPLERCLVPGRHPAHIGCDCCPTPSSPRTSIAYDPRSSRLRGQPSSGGPQAGSYGPGSKGGSASSAPRS